MTSGADRGLIYRIFDAALDLEAEARAAFVSERCGENTELSRTQGHPARQLLLSDDLLELHRDAEAATVALPGSMLLTATLTMPFLRSRAIRPS
jgi:hypothetical protein